MPKSGHRKRNGRKRRVRQRSTSSPALIEAAKALRLDERELADFERILAHIASTRKR